MSARLESKVAIVTGGASGYGRGIVEKLKTEGAEVVLLDLNVSAGQRTASQLGAAFVHADVTKRSDWEKSL